LLSWLLSSERCCILLRTSRLHTSMTSTSIIYLYKWFPVGDQARWQIVDIPIPQWQLTTLKKEDQGTPKGTHRVP
jgi:hypothetical protein